MSKDGIITLVCSKCQFTEVKIGPEFIQHFARRSDGRSRFRKVCRDCNNKRQAELFAQNKDRYVGYHKKYKQKYPERFRAYMRDYKQRNAERIRIWWRKYQRQRRLLMTPEQKQAHTNRVMIAYAKKKNPEKIQELRQWKTALSFAQQEILDAFFENGCDVKKTAFATKRVFLRVEEILTHLLTSAPHNLRLLYTKAIRNFSLALQNKTEVTIQEMPCIPMAKMVQTDLPQNSFKSKEGFPGYNPEYEALIYVECRILAGLPINRLYLAELSGYTPHENIRLIEGVAKRLRRSFKME